MDEVSSTHPIAIWHESVHEFYLNSAIVDLLKLDQEDIYAAWLRLKLNLNLTRISL
ncbi:MAG: hypothetical protein AAGC88_15850 [Bacteroidota bacterium]